MQQLKDGVWVTMNSWNIDTFSHWSNFRTGSKLPGKYPGNITSVQKHSGNRFGFYIPSFFFFKINRWSFTAGLYFTKEICVQWNRWLLEGNRGFVPCWRNQTCERRDAAKRNSDRIHSKSMKLVRKCSENLATARWEMKCEYEDSPVRAKTTAF